ncbi:glycosyltransferase [Deinococcus radiophilus]|uniref:Glycosyltransferase family 28 N-terminal domain-containing protein n=1 Tax=Deinococcus radiophilus TaxID=32062 RepID=A0A3S0KA50_9DEIO|nr:hypothetical protein [Deinococcus radiophilus]RTR26106.1 hypothetical protein EJ104_08915 [Deinococcus radiophilus]UFA51584.1 hypothetical protein LMT64_10920 [Deinococcus radiophilus]
MNILLATQPIAGHVWPMAALACELAARGHTLRWYTGHRYAAQVQQAGAFFGPFIHAREDDAADFKMSPGREGQAPGLKRLLFEVREVFVGQIEGQVHDLRGLRHIASQRRSIYELARMSRPEVRPVRRSEIAPPRPQDVSPGSRHWQQLSQPWRPE